MIITCERCTTSFVLDDALIPPQGAPVQCSRCQNVFTARRNASPPAAAAPSGRPLIITCERCATVFDLDDALIPPQGAPVQCTRCGHLFTARRDLPQPEPTSLPWHVGPTGAPPRRNVMLFGAPPPRPPAPPGPNQRNNVMVFGSGFEQPTAPPAPARPRAEPALSPSGRLLFGAAPPSAAAPGTPGQVMVFGAPRTAQPAFVPAPPKAPATELERMKAHSAEHLDDEQALLVLSDALMEQGDPQGRLIAFMLEEERGTELMRKVKVNVLIRDHATQWAPPGAKITAFHRGLPTELEWFGATDPHHVSWRSARAIACSLETVPSPSVFEVIRPQLERVSGLNRALLAHVLVAAPPQLASLDVLLFNEAPAEAITRTRARLPALNRLTLRTTLAPLDDSLRDGRLRTVMEASRGLRGVRLSMPRLSLSLIDECLALAPKLDLQFVIPWRDTLRETQLTLVVDPRRRLLHLPQSTWLDAQLRDFLATLHGLLGEELQVVRD